MIIWSKFEIVDVGLQKSIYVFNVSCLNLKFVGHEFNSFELLNTGVCTYIPICHAWVNAPEMSNVKPQLTHDICIYPME